MQGKDLAETAKSFIGTPFHAQGRAPGAGLDCIGVVACVARAHNITHDDKSAYSMTPTGELQPELERQMIRINPNDMREGDVLLMRWRPGMPPHHVAMCVGPNLIVHAYSTARKVSMQVYTDFWRDKTVAIYRFKEVD